MAKTETKTVRVLIVDDSAFIRSALRRALANMPGVSVVDTATNGTEALEKIVALKPDVVTLDVEMPGMSGLDVLEQVMRRQPTPCVMVSSKTRTGAEATLTALQRGAVECLAKPSGDAGSSPEAFYQRFVHAVLGAAESNRSNLGTSLTKGATPAPSIAPPGAVVAIGISAGGPPTLQQIFPLFPPKFAPIIVTQHMPAAFTGAFANRLDSMSQILVKEAEDGDELQAGTALIAPGDQHLLVVRDGTRLVARLSNGPKVSGFRPSVDAMFESLANTVGRRTVAVVMTGMGCDGSLGVRQLKSAGAATIAQDQATSIVYGMPKAAAATGCIDQVLPLAQIPAGIAAALGAPSPGVRREPRMIPAHG